MLPLLLVGFFLVAFSFFVGSDYGEKVLGGEHSSLQFWSFWIGIGSIVISVILLVVALIFTGIGFGMMLRD